MERVVGEDGLSVSIERAGFEDGVRQEARQGDLRMDGSMPLLVVASQSARSCWNGSRAGSAGGDSFGWNGSCSRLHRFGHPAVEDC